RLAQVAARRRHSAGGAEEQRQEGADSAAARRAAQERAGRASVRARGVSRPLGALMSGAGKAAMRFVEPVVLKGRHATLEPLGREHATAVTAAAADGELWRLWY